LPCPPGRCVGGGAGGTDPDAATENAEEQETRMAGNLKLLAGLGAGYVLGARAGRERYERIAEATRRLAEERPEVRELIGTLRSHLGASLEKAADTASDRPQQARGEDGAPEDQDRAAAGGPASTQRPVQGTGQAPPCRGRPGSWRGPRRDRVATVPGR
jgi:hypothetical protein